MMMQAIDSDKSFWDAYYLIQVATLQCQSAIGLDYLEHSVEHLEESRSELQERT